MAPTIEGNKLLLDGFVYYRSRRAKGRQYWDCNRVRAKECTARAVTNDPGPNEQLVIFKGPSVSSHQHPPNVEEGRALKITNSLKRKAAENPAEPPARLIRCELAAVPPEVLSQLPEREALKNSHEKSETKESAAKP